MPGFALQAAIVAALEGAELGGADVYGDAPGLDAAREPDAFPYLCCSDLVVTNNGTASGDIWHVLVRLHAFSLDPSTGELRAMMQGAAAAVTRKAVRPHVEGFSLIYLRPDGSERDRDPDGTRHGILRFRAIMVPPDA